MRSACRACRTCTATPFSAGWPASPSGAGRAADSFWSWRELMYRFVERIDPGAIRGARHARLGRDARGGLHARRRVPLPAPRSRPTGGNRSLNRLPTAPPQTLPHTARWRHGRYRRTEPGPRPASSAQGRSPQGSVRRCRSSGRAGPREPTRLGFLDRLLRVEVVHRFVRLDPVHRFVGFDPVDRFVRARSCRSGPSRRSRRSVRCCPQRSVFSLLSAGSVLSVLSFRRVLSLGAVAGVAAGGIAWNAQAVGAG